MAVVSESSELMTTKRTLLALVCGALLLWCTLAILSHGAGVRWRDAEAHLLEHRRTLVDDARAWIAASGDSASTAPPPTPASLSIPHLAFAEVGQDHVQLVLASSPDSKSGFRVWVSPIPDDFSDRETSLPFVTRFTFVDDYPESPTNRP